MQIILFIKKSNKQTLELKKNIIDLRSNDSENQDNFDVLNIWHPEKQNIAYIYLANFQN